jgi:hypothetical protein
MKNTRLKTLTTILSVLACFGLAFGAEDVSPAAPDSFSGSNTFDGFHALHSQTANTFNSAFGWQSLATQTTATAVTGCGAGTLVFNTTDNNSAFGAAALEFNTTGGLNVAVGGFSLLQNVDGDDNTAVGMQALQNNVSGVTNAALGVFAAQNSAANFNTAVGGFALRANTGGDENTAVGAGAIESGDGGNDNTAVGFLAGNDISGNSNTCLGHSTGSTLAGGEGNIYIGAEVQPGGTGEFEFIRIGNDGAFTFPYDTYIAGIYGRPVGPAPLAVMCGSDGKLTANVSSRRFKHDIKPMVNASDAILALKPVSFRYNNDSTNAPWFGLIAEDVAEVNPDLIVRDKEGKPFSVRYDAVNAMLLNEFIKEHKKVEEQQASISQLKSEMQTMVAQLKEQAAQIQKVSAQLEVNKPAPQVVVNKP